jgi:hypothetical protein
MFAVSVGFERFGRTFACTVPKRRVDRMAAKAADTQRLGHVAIAERVKFRFCRPAVQESRIKKPESGLPCSKDGMTWVKSMLQPMPRLIKY